MKKKFTCIIILILMIIIIISLMNLFWKESIKKNTCMNTAHISGLCVEIEFQSVINNKTIEVSKGYDFPYYTRQGDHLVIKKIDVYNLDNSTMNKTTINLKLSPIGYEEKRLETYYPPNYGELTIYIPSLEGNGHFWIETEENLYYSLNSNNSNLSEMEKPIFMITFLYINGNWGIKEDITQGEIGKIGYSLFTNGYWRLNIFNVNEPVVIENMNDMKNSLIWAILAVIVALVLFCITKFEICEEKVN